MNVISKTRKSIASLEGFTLVELLIVVIVSLIILAGLVGLLSAAFGSFTRSRDLQAITDSSRRALASMARQMKGLLRIDDANSNDSTIAFWADVENDSPTATTETDHYGEAERVVFYRDTNTSSSTYNQIIQSTTQPAAQGGATTTASLGAYVTRLNFYYFEHGSTPGSGDPPSNRYLGSDLNESTGWIRVVITVNKGDATRTMYQDVFLRTIDRKD